MSIELWEVSNAYEKKNHKEYKLLTHKLSYVIFIFDNISIIYYLSFGPFLREDEL